MNVPEVVECHAIRVRRSGKAIFVDFRGGKRSNSSRRTFRRE